MLLAAGALFYIPLGSRRGYLQGTYGFRSLATNLVLEGLIRLGGSLFLIWLGLGVRGVIVANSAAVALAYFAILPRHAVKIPNPLRFSYALRETLQAVTFFSGQVIINNCDIVLVEHFFAAREAGLYAAVAMVGRVISAISSSVVNGMFPLVAGSREEERKDLTVIATSLFMVLGIGSVLAIILRFTPAVVWTAFLGSKFEVSGPYGLSYLLALYAITSVVYSLSAVIITFEMSYKIANTSWVQLVFSGVVIVGICRYHSSLREVILVQLILMAMLLVMVAFPFLMDSLTFPVKIAQSGTMQSVRLIREISEDEVIAEFLKSDFHNPAFQNYRKILALSCSTLTLKTRMKTPYAVIVCHSAFRSVERASIQMEWYEVKVREPEVAQIRVFPRAHWRKIASGNFSITRIVEGMQRDRGAVDEHLMVKIAEIRERLVQNDSIGPVILIGVNESEPLTILDGNHRLVAAMFGSPNKVQGLRFLCGFSPRMDECCWYNTNFVTLFRYGRNVLRNVTCRPGLNWIGSCRVLGGNKLLHRVCISIL